MEDVNHAAADNRIVAVMSLKGGVGKTSVTLGLAGSARSRGLKTLVLDLDPQANATTALDPEPFTYTTNDVLHDARTGIAKEAIVRSGWGADLDVLPSERALEHRSSSAGKHSASRLRLSLTGVVDSYDLVLIDCPPSLGELTRNAMAASHKALVVTEPSFFALQGAAQAIEAVDVARAATNLRLAPAGIVINRVKRSAEHTMRTAELRDAFGDLVLTPVIPERAVVAQAQGSASPVQAWKSSSARELSAIFDALLSTLVDPEAKPRAKRKNKDAS